MDSESKLRDAARAAFQRGDFATALAHYSSLLAARGGSDAVLLANRSVCLLELGGARRAAEALADAGKATRLSPEYQKAWYRKARGESRETTMNIEQRRRWLCCESAGGRVT